jgi:hypothetical protein
VDEAVQPLQQPEQRRRDDREDAVIDDEVEALGELGELVLLLRPNYSGTRQAGRAGATCPSA